MKRLLRLLLLLCPVMAAASPAVPTYFCDFEDEAENSQWVSWPGNSRLYETWKSGRQLQCSGKYGLYTSDTQIDTIGNNTHSCVTIEGYTVSTYRRLSLTAGTYDISLDYFVPGGQISVALVQADTLLMADLRTRTGSAYAQVIQGANIYNLTDISSKVWTHKTAPVAVLGTATDYLLVVTYRSQGEDLPIGAAVDNIEVVKRQSDPTACDYKIRDFTVDLVSGYAQLTWKGNADKYEVRYYNSDSLMVTLDTVYAGTTSDVDTCLIPLESIPNGVYSFMVRTADCEANSPWAYIRNKLIYDPSSHCIDYLNFEARGVQCSYGEGNWDGVGATETIRSTNYGYQDYGYKSRYSTHTLHFDPQERDAMTDGQLRTVPQGAFASVRIGGKEPTENWPGGHFQSVKYTIHVDSTIGVVLFRYAYVGQTGGHGSGSLTQPHLRLELTDQYGNVINGTACGSFLFMAPDNDTDMRNLNRNPRTAGWHKGLSDDGQGSVCPDYVYWRDWTTVGVNVQQYLDQDIHVRITNYGCGQSCHYGYAYFVLDCASGKLGGVTCGEKPREMVADDGFAYRWYKPFNPMEPFYEGQDSTAQSLYVSPNDSNTYYVDLMSKSNSNCYFTLHASAMARLPKASIEFRHAPKDCKNYVEVDNRSGLFGFFTNAETGEPDSIRIEGGLSQQKWRITTASGTTTMEVDTTTIDPILVAEDGDMVRIDLQVLMEEGCEETRHFEFEVPAIGPNSSIDSLILCQGQSIEYEGKIYTEAGDYELMKEKNWAGCDSTRMLHIDYEFSYIFQRWNDVLSVKKSPNPDSDVDTYDFVAFQWVRNGEPIPGATQSYYYAGEGQELSSDDVYRVILTHADGTAEESCDFIPGVTALNIALDDPVQVNPTRLHASQTMQIICPFDATAVIYNALGTRVGQATLKRGVTYLPAPAQSGFYILAVTGNHSKRRQTIRISVY